MKVLILAAALAGSAANTFAATHTGFCRYGEDCGVIVSEDIYEAVRICARNAFDPQALRVRQRQADGSIKWLGYVCVERSRSHRVE